MEGSSQAKGRRRVAGATWPIERQGRATWKAGGGSSGGGHVGRGDELTEGKGREELRGFHPARENVGVAGCDRDETPRT